MIGRYQPWHKGHQWLLDELLEDKTEGVLIGVRDTPQDKDNPYYAVDVVQNIKAWLLNNRKQDFHRILVQVIPDISGVHYGRGVGWEIVEHVPPEDIGKVSATKIREGNAENISVPPGPLSDGITV